MDLFTLILGLLGLVVGAAGSVYTYLSYRQSRALLAPITRTILPEGCVGDQFSAPETLLFLLLIDQFPNGLSGASLERNAEFYGHKGDPGSITISTYSARSITAVTGSWTAEPVRRYRSYLLSRRSPRGAFGMRRSPGTPKYPEHPILEHARHTATALRFFLFYDGPEHDGPARVRRREQASLAGC